MIRWINFRAEHNLKVVIPPSALVPGRIEFYLALDYDCDGKRVPDRTEVVTYQLLG